MLSTATRSVIVLCTLLSAAAITTFGESFLPQLEPIGPANLSRLEQLMQLDIPASMGLQEMASIAFSPNGRYLAASGLSSSLPVWDMASGELVWQFEEDYRIWVCADIHPTEPVLIAGTLSGNVWLFDLETGTRIGWHQTGNSGVHSVHFSNDGSQVVSVNIYSSVSVWSVAEDWSLSLVVSSRAHGNRVNYADFSPDNRRIVSGGADNKARVWDAQTGDQYFEMTEPGRYVEGVQYSPDGSLIAGAADDRLVYLWDAVDGDLITSFWGSNGPVNGVTFNHTGTLIAGFSNGLMVLVWDLVSPRSPTRLYGHDGLVLRGAFSPDDRILASVSRDQTVILWGVPASGDS